MQNEREDGQLCLYAPESFYGKTSQEPSPAEPRRERTSALSWKKSVELKTIPFLSLEFTSGHGSLLEEFCWELISPWLGDAWTLGTGVSPRDEKESSLLQILQDAAPLKYYLSRKSCLGILRRTEARNHSLPGSLEKALKIQAEILEYTDSPWTENQTLLFENHGIDSRYTGPLPVSPTLSARCGTGGNNVPLVIQEVFCISGNAIDRLPKKGGNGIGYQRDISYALTTADRHAVACGMVFHGDGRHLIRRLTPLECERLQGFPDGWTDIPGASDTLRYRALGNSVAIPCVDFILRKTASVLREEPIEMNHNQKEKGKEKP